MTSSGRVRIGARAARRVTVALAAVLVTASCAAGQDAQTADIKAAVDAGNGKVGAMLLQGVAIHAPEGSSYPAGASVELAISLINNGTAADTLVNVTSPAFSGWAIVSNADAVSGNDSSGGDTGLTVPANSARRLGLVKLGASATNSPRTLVLRNLAAGSAPLFPGANVAITFRFANAGSTVVKVPVQITDVPNHATVPAMAGTPAE